MAIVKKSMSTYVLRPILLIVTYFREKCKSFSLYVQNLHRFEALNGKRVFINECHILQIITNKKKINHAFISIHFTYALWNDHLILNVNKRKEMIVKFKRNRLRSNTISIMGKKWRWSIIPWCSVETRRDCLYSLVFAARCCISSLLWKVQSFLPSSV